MEIPAKELSILPPFGKITVFLLLLLKLPFFYTKTHFILLHYMSVSI